MYNGKCKSTNTYIEILSTYHTLLDVKSKAEKVSPMVSQCDSFLRLSPFYLILPGFSTF